MTSVPKQVSLVEHSTQFVGQRVAEPGSVALATLGTGLGVGTEIVLGQVAVDCCSLVFLPSTWFEEKHVDNRTGGKPSQKHT